MYPVWLISAYLLFATRRRKLVAYATEFFYFKETRDNSGWEKAAKVYKVFDSMVHAHLSTNQHLKQIITAA